MTTMAASEMFALVDGRETLSAQVVVSRPSWAQVEQDAWKPSPSGIKSSTNSPTA